MIVFLATAIETGHPLKPVAVMLRNFRVSCSAAAGRLVEIHGERYVSIRR
jgi:hypothetical protein